MSTIFTHIYRVRAILALLFLSSASLWAQSDDATLTNITNLEQLHAIRYDLDGDGVVSFTTAASLTGSPMFSDRAAVVTLMGADSIYAQAFTSGAFYAAADGIAAATGAVAVSTTYYYKLSSAATSSYTGYELRNNLDFEDADGDGTADDKSIWAEGASGAGVPDAVAEGWAPLGYWNSSTDNASYTATFDGGGYTISNLYINRPSTNGVGLFGALASGSNVRNLGIEGGSVTGNDYVGGLVGQNQGTIRACYATGAASGDDNVGGLVGGNFGTISACYATGNATGTGEVGGLVGSSSGTISACYATGNATGTGNTVGGLVGSSSGTIRACYATGAASGRASVGGLVGYNVLGTISACYATGNATGTGSDVGGLVGYDEGTISACYATGNASGNSLVGGLVGGNDGTISACYATGNATGTGGSVGGLVGSGTVTNSYFDSTVSNRTDSDSYDKTTAELQTPTAYGTAMDIYANWNIDVDDGQPIGVDDGTAAGDSDTDDPWDFGTDSEYPALKVDFDRSGTPSVAEFGTQVRAAPATVPDAPTALTATAADAAVTLNWTAPTSDGGASIINYMLEYDTDMNFSSSPTTVPTATAVTSHAISGLANGTPYYFRVAAVNSVGTGAYYPGATDAAVSATPAPTAPAAPSALMAAAANAAVTLSWTAAASDGGAAITSYTIDYDTDMNFSSSPTTVPTVTAVTSHAVSGLTNGTPYYFRVAAVNSVGTGAYYPGATDAAVTATPAPTAPSAPSALTAAAANTAVTLSWTAPTSDGGAPITSYTIDYDTDMNFSSSPTTVPTVTAVTSHAISGLANGTPYYFRVAAVNSVGTGAYYPGATDAAVTATPAPTAPSAPSALMAAAANTAVTLSWTAPTSDGGAPITSYTIDYDTDMNFSSSPTTVPTMTAVTSHAVSGLANGTPYYFRVAAVNSVGTGAYYPGATDAAVSATAVDNLIDVTTLEQLNAIRYNLNGNGVVSFTTAASLPAADFSDRTAVVALMGADSIYAQAFGGAFYTAADGTAAATGAVAVSTTYYYKLSSMATSPYIGYELTSNLDLEDADGNGTADDKSIWAEGATAAGVADAVAGGWAPIGDNSSFSAATQFTATFDGGDYTISNLYIDRSSTSYVGLFGALGLGSNVRNLGIVGGSLSGGDQVGGLVGSLSSGTISACYATGTVRGGDNVGGLVGISDGTMSACYATGTLRGGDNVGGLVGRNGGGTMSACYATGTVHGGDQVGGLVGNSDGTISACYATGAVRGGEQVGGLVGVAGSGSISACYATGTVHGRSSVGGLLGDLLSGSVSACYATGAVLGAGHSVGGLVGYLGQVGVVGNSGSISACYATGFVRGDIQVGGLVGVNSNGSMSNSYCDTETSGQTNAIGRISLGTNITNVSGKTTAELQMPTAYGTAMDIYSNWNIDVDDGQPIGVDDGTAAGDSDTDDPWDFGTDSQYPALQVDFDGSSTATAAEFGDQPRTTSSVPLTVFGFSPTRGVPNTEVKIWGTAFSSTAEEDSISFGGSDYVAAASFIADSRSGASPTIDTLTVSVPSDAQRGTIRVKVLSGQPAASFGPFIRLRILSSANLIDVTTLEQLNAIRYNLNGNGVVSFTTAASLTGSPMFSNRTAVVALMGAASAYAEAFTSGDFYDAANGSSAATGAVAASTTYYYKLSNMATSPYAGYELMNSLDFEDADGNGTADDKSIWAEGADAAGVSGAVAEGWSPIGYYGGGLSNIPYAATFDGNRHTISNLYINRPSTNNIGLFGILGSGRNVRNLGIEGGSLTGDSSVGGLVGENSGMIRNCYATETVRGQGNVGGLVGTNRGSIRACYATGDASGSSVGGLVGTTYGNLIAACYATGNVAGGNDLAGGLVGYLGIGSVKGCYATGNVSGATAGGLVGSNDPGNMIEVCYATGIVSGNDGNVGGLVGSNNRGVISNSYFDTETASQTDAIGGRTTSGTNITNVSGKTTAELQTPIDYAGIYADWNIDVDGGQRVGVDDGTMPGDAAADAPWDFGTDMQYPALQVDFDGSSTSTAAEFGDQPRTASGVSLTVLGFSPMRGIANTEVKIWGTVFSSTAEENSISFGGSDYVAATSFTADSRSGVPPMIDTLTVNVPSGTQTGTIRVKVQSGQPVASLNLFVVLRIDGFTPTSGAVGATVMITGTFSTSFRENIVTFLGAEGDADNAAATVSAATATSLTVSVPSTAQTGKISVMIVSAADTSDASFTVTASAPAPAAPVVSSFSPIEGVVDTEVTITGVNFSDMSSENEVRFGGVMAADPTSASTTSLTVLVPSGAVTGRVSVAVGGQTGTSSEIFTVTVPAPAPAAPVVSSFSPTEGEVDTEVTITGVNFSATPSANDVRFGGMMAADPTSASTTSLVVLVPSGAVTGRVSVAVGGQTGTSSEDFTVTVPAPAPAPPVVLSFSPIEGAVDTEVTITGENFSDMPSENEVRFGGVMAADPTSASTTSLTVKVPSGAVTGRVSVAVGGQTGTSSEDFTVTVPAPAPAPPVVLSFSPIEGAVDTEVTITGDNFSDMPSENEVRFGGVMAADPTSASTTSLVVLVPSGARTGSISVAVGGQTGTSSTNFTVTGTTPEPAAFSVPVAEGDVRVYPNPTSGQLHFKGLLAGGRYVCDLYSLVGQKVLSSVVRAGDTMDTSTLSSGQYILILQAEGRELMRTRLLVVR